MIAIETLAHKLKNYCKEHPPQYGDAESLLDVLYWHFAEFNPMDSSEAKAQFANLRNTLHYLSEQEFDAVFGIVSCICVEQERTAFKEGLRLGVALVQELNE